MSSAHRRTLPARPNLEQQKKLAKELLASFDRGDPDATARVRAELPDKRSIALADAQFVLAREYGFESWPALKEHIDTLRAAEQSPVEAAMGFFHSGDAKGLRALLQRHKSLRAMINAPLLGFDSPPLVSASSHGNVEMVDVLLEFGADPNRKSSWWAGGFHPLYGANEAVAERLLAAGAVPDACAAAHLDRPDLLERILAEDPSRVHERGGDGQTPLHFARTRRIADMLIAAGADLDARDIDHRSTPAEWMIGDADRVPLAKYLVERGASADIFLAAALGLTDRARVLLGASPSMLDLRTGQGDYGEKKPSSFHIYLWTIGSNFTPLQTAAKFGQLETLAAMIERALPRQRLLLACHEGDGETARAIVRANPGIIERLDARDRRSLTDEAWTGNAAAVELMMELGFDPAAASVSGPTGGTALHCATWQGSVACVSAILRYPSGRALIDTREPTYNGTPLSWCCHGSRNCGDPRANHAAVAKLLLEAGARLDPKLQECSEEMQAVLDHTG